MRRPYTLVPVGLVTLLLATVLISVAGCPGMGTGGGGGIANLPPTVALTADVQRGVAPLPVRFSSSGSTDDGVIISRDWNFGDGETSQEIAPLHIYTTTGEFVVTLTLTDDQGVSSSRTLDMSVTERPVAVISVDQTSAASAPAQIQFDGAASFDPDAKPGDELLFSWDFDDGSRATGDRDEFAVIDHIFSRAGTFRVTLTVTDATGITGHSAAIIEIGIRQPQIVFRSPLPHISNIVCSNDSPLWVNAIFDVEPGVPRRIRAGLDRDLDACNAMVVLYDPRTGDEEFRLTGNNGLGHAEPVRATALAPDGVTVASAGDDGTVRFYDALSGAYLRNFVGSWGTINALAYSSTGERLALATSSGVVAVLDPRDEAASDPLVSDPATEYVGHIAAVNGIAYSPDGSRILSGDSDGAAILWSTADGSEITRFTHTAGGSLQVVYATAFLPTNPQAVATGAEDNTARIWDSATGTLIQQFAPAFSGGTQIAGHRDAVLSIDFSSDGLEILTGSADGTAKLWNVATGAELRTFEGHGDAVNAVAFAPDNLQVASGSSDSTVRVWDVPTGGELAISPFEPCESAVTDIDYSTDGTKLVASIAARNEIALDTNPSQGADLNLSLPIALDLTDVPSAVGGQQYFLWAEVRTDRTRPTRRYAQRQRSGQPPLYTHVNVIPDFDTSTAGAPLVPLREVEDPCRPGVMIRDAAVVVPIISPLAAAPRRRVFDIGALSAGDRMIVSLLTTPGYGDTYMWGGFSLQVLDGQNQHYAWYQNGITPFTIDDRLIIGHASDHHYFSVDNDGAGHVPSVRVRVEDAYAAGAQPRQQRVFLEFRAVQNLTVGGSLPFSLPPANFGSVLRNSLVNRLNTLFAAYDVTITTSALDDPPAAAHNAIYFDTTSKLVSEGGVDEADLLRFGLPNTLDVQNQTGGEYAVIAVAELLDAIGFVDETTRGVAIGNATAHQIGLLAGLRQTQGVNTDVMARTGTNLTSTSLEFVDPPPVSNLTSSFNLISPIGTQNANQLLLEAFGPP